MNVANNDYDQLRFFIEIEGIPEGTTYYRAFQRNMEITQAGLQNGMTISDKCMGGST
jgi:hypothetical protein